jgi:hypothetical protein
MGTARSFFDRCEIRPYREFGSVKLSERAVICIAKIGTTPRAELDVDI